MKLDLEVDTEKLNDDQLQKFKDFLISINFYTDDQLKIPEEWSNKKPWWKIW